MPVQQVPPPLKQATIERLIENHDQALDYGLYTADNLKLLARGKSPYATKGPHTGQRMDSEHMVPKSVVPGVDNLLMNLEWLPSGPNQSKSNRITPRALRFAKMYFEAGLIDGTDFTKVEALAE